VCWIFSAFEAEEQFVIVISLFLDRGLVSVVLYFDTSDWESSCVMVAVSYILIQVSAKVAVSAAKRYYFGFCMRVLQMHVLPSALLVLCNGCAIHSIGILCS
jgi:hypothetical protein